MRKIVHAFADWQQAWMDSADGWMGRRLWDLFNSNGLFDGGVYAHVMTETVYGPTISKPLKVSVAGRSIPSTRGHPVRSHGL